MKQCTIILVAEDREDLFILLNSELTRNLFYKNLKEVFYVTKRGHVFVKVEDGNEKDMRMLRLLEEEG
jgi:hypothetical protein